MSTPARGILTGRLATIVTLALVCASPAWGTCTTRVSVASEGTEGNYQSWVASISADGRYVAFHALASNLVPGDTNNDYDVFVHDRVTGATTRVSVASDGTQANGVSSYAALSADGRYVAFNSFATNLVPGDTNNNPDIFVHDRQTGTTTRVSVASDGTEGNGASSYPSISADGRYVAFNSLSWNLVPDDTNNQNDVFVHDRLTGATTRVSVASDGAQGNNQSWIFSSISADGRYVAFYSSASNLVPADTNGMDDVFVHDRQTGATTRVSVASDGTQGNNWSIWPAISADGRYVAFQSFASNLVPADTNAKYDVFVHDCVTGTTARVSVATAGTQGNGHSGSYGLSVSADGRYVAFESRASNLVPADTNGQKDVFVHDCDTGVTTRASVASDGAQGNGGSQWPSISADGRFVAFDSGATNLVPGDGNSANDVFVHDCNAGCPVPGDLNCDGAVDFGDINPFVLLLTNPAAWQAANPGCPPENGDISGDGSVDFGDINPFVALLAAL
jgi:Tol biopolymer transport system component